jgi:thiamine pyrophosphate-dependent acetolactate synthase large subunit-like protein
MQIDIDPRMLSIRYPMEVGLAGDSAETLRQLPPFLQHKTDRSWRASIEKDVAEWWRTLEARAENDANSINPVLSKKLRRREHPRLDRLLPKLRQSNADVRQQYRRNRFALLRS